ncbi:MAG: diguanylate cyclase [Desulfocapsaceae bacterium]|nr:diguanylate cyclase [Desulfocapsaceae bacterium]
MQARVRAFRSIRNRILLFSILVTMLPSLGIGWYWFDLTHKATSEKVEQKLLDSASFAEREINLWLEERSFDLRAFANSPLVLESIRSTIPEGKKAQKKAAIKASSQLRKLSSYLTLVRDQYSDYRRLMILDGNGTIIATSGSDDSDLPLSLPDNWEEQTAKLRLFSGDAFSVQGEAAPLLLLGIPLFTEQDSPPLGFFVMEVRLQCIPQLLRNSLPLSGAGRDPYTISLFKMNGELIVSTALPVDKSATLISPQKTIGLFAVPHLLKEFVNERQERVVGVSIPLRHLPWHLLVTEKYDTIFSGLIQNRNRIILIAVLLTIAIGGLATIIASQIITPLQDLTKGVLRVADGDLDVAVAIHRQDELGLVTKMFNIMISRLKEDQQKLELLATTDFLTGLANRKQIMTDLAQEIEQYRRHSTKFSLLMMDIDHFKTVNDTHGHLVGDAVLVQLARIFKDTLRILDSAGRYGGEEFLIVLGQADLQQALQTAERIRLAVQQHIFTCDDVTLHATISIGVTEMSSENRTINELIDRADQALYEAKKHGRNRVVSG